MTWAAVITLVLMAWASAATFRKPIAPVSEDARKMSCTFRVVWFSALAYALWDKYL